MKTEDVLYCPFSTCSSGLWVWYLVSLLQTLWVSSLTVCTTLAVFIITSAINSTTGNGNASGVQCPVESRSIFTPRSVSSTVYVVYEYVCCLCCLWEAKVKTCCPRGLPDKNLQEHLTPKAEAWPHLLPSPFPSAGWWVPILGQNKILLFPLSIS